MAGNWDFGGAYAGTAGELQRQDITAAREPLVLAQMAAGNRLRNAQAEAAEMEISAEKQTQTLMQQMSLTGLEEGPGAASKLAEIYARAGNPKAAGDMLLKASQMQAADATRSAAQARQATQEATRTIAMGERYAGLLAGVRSQEELDAANMIFMSEFGQDAPPAARVYDPRTVEMLAGSSMTMAQRAKAKLDEADQERLVKDSEALRRQRDAAAAASLALKRQRDAKQTADGKAGGKDIGSPTKAELTAATSLLAADGLYDDMDPDAAEVAAFDIASQAKAMVRRTPGLDISQAMQRAFAESKARGAFVAPTGGIFGFGRTKGKYTPRGAPAVVNSLEQLMALPPRAKFIKDGQMYENLGNGKVRKLPGGGGMVTGDVGDDEGDEE